MMWTYEETFASPAKIDYFSMKSIWNEKYACKYKQLFFDIYDMFTTSILHVLLTLYVSKKNWPYFWKNICSYNDNVHISKFLKHFIPEPPYPVQCWTRNSRFSREIRRNRALHGVLNIVRGSGGSQILDENMAFRIASKK